MQQYGEYSQFIVMALVFLVGAAIYGGYLYYKKQEDMKKVNANLQQQQNIQTQQNVNQQKQASQQKQPQQAPDFVKSDSFRGGQKGYKFKSKRNYSQRIISKTDLG